ncbi:DUF2264 domain-containing protein [Streptomyces hoynatensis]|uniref:DUF2264 domain-containing protein n=1 Tax=Streptomyces hoynatensis TaxID=1141874 RepID=A0A3A9YLE1_9ACTN|nr:DUF2264 domain-containing protein [Streptomyces hoynatensis]
MPAPDPELSPHTGWTRAHWAAYADKLLAAVEAHRSPGGARVALPGPASAYGRDSDGLEGFARTFLLAGFRVAGEGGADPLGLLERHAAGLAAGTDPRSPEYWPRPDRLGQAKVEAASLALILQLTRPWLWDRLDDRVRERVVAWLGTVVGQPYPPINWVWFRIVVESFLREVGGPWSRADVEADLAVHASLRREGGWLSDGAGERAFDHYTGWALHLYPALWTRLFDVTGTLCPPALRARWDADLARYLQDAVRLIGADGSPLLQGRSLVYRFAAAAPLWAAAFAGVDALPPGLTRRAASGLVRHFADRGVPGADGLLSLGWYGPWPAMRQAYSGPGSPYWAAKGLLGLALPAGHPVWTAPEEPLPVEREDVTRVVAAPGWLVSARRADGFAIVLNHGTDHAAEGAETADAPLYARLGYSTATLPPPTGPAVADPLDNSVVLLDAAGRATHRSGFATLFARRLPGGVLAAASRGRAHWVDARADASPDHGSGRAGAVLPGPLLTVASLLRDGVEVRLARIEEGGAPAEGAAALLALRFGGWPLAADEEPRTAAREAAGTGSGGEAGAGARAEPGHGAAGAATVGGLRSALYGLRGLGRAGVALARDASPLGRVTAVPWLATAAAPRPGELYAAAVLLDRTGAAGALPPGAPALPRVVPGALPGTLTVHWPATRGGLPALATALTLPPPPGGGPPAPAEGGAAP